MNVGDDQAKLSLITEELRQHVIELTMLPVVDGVRRVSAGRCAISPARSANRSS